MNRTRDIAARIAHLAADVVRLVPPIERPQARIQRPRDLRRAHRAARERAREERLRRQRREGVPARELDQAEDGDRELCAARGVSGGSVQYTYVRAGDEAYQSDDLHSGERRGRA